MRITFRPLTSWPGVLRTDRQRAIAPFGATWEDTVALLEREAGMLGARELVIQLAITESELRRDGWPRATARPQHPGAVIVLPNSRHGRVSFATDRYSGSDGHGKTGPNWGTSRRTVRRTAPGWQANLRAIGLSMEALRAADRHGVTQGRQYAGFRELGAGTPMPAGQMNVEDAARFITRYSDFHDDTWPGCISHPPQMMLDPAYRMAAKRLHPDRGGDPALFQRLQEAKRLLDEHGTRG